MNTEQLSTSADPQEEIAALKVALREKSEIIKRLQVKADKWDALDEKIAKYYTVTDEELESNLDDSDGLIGIGEAAAQAFGYL